MEKNITIRVCDWPGCGSDHEVTRMEADLCAAHAASIGAHRPEAVKDAKKPEDFGFIHRDEVVRREAVRRKAVRPARPQAGTKPRPRPKPRPKPGKTAAGPAATRKPATRKPAGKPAFGGKTAFAAGVEYGSRAFAETGIKVPAQRTPAGRSSQELKAQAAKRQEIRAWAARTGHEIPAKGRIPRKVADAWASANPGRVLTGNHSI